jgi:hypothetical protein
LWGSQQHVADSNLWPKPRPGEAPNAMLRPGPKRVLRHGRSGGVDLSSEQSVFNNLFYSNASICECVCCS